MPTKHYSAKDSSRNTPSPDKELRGFARAERQPRTATPRGISSRKHTPQTHAQNAPQPHENAQYIRQYRLLNRWSIFLLLAVSSLIIVLFVSNTLEVNRLFEDVNILRQEHRRLVQQNEVLQAKSVRLQSPERITEIAREKLGMIHPSTAPEILK
jgi:cell division protein FtsL